MAVQVNPSLPASSCLVPGFNALYSKQAINSTVQASAANQTSDPTVLRPFTSPPFTSEGHPASPVSPTSSEHRQFFGDFIPVPETGSNKLNETTPLIRLPDSAIRNKITCSSKLGKFIYCIPFLVFFIMISTAACITLFVIPWCNFMSGSGTDLAVNGDYVLLTCKVNWWILHTTHFRISNVTSSKSLVSKEVTVNIFMVPYKQLMDLIKTRPEPLQLDFSSNNSAQLAPSIKKFFFANCSSYLRKCILEQYLYFVDSGSAFVSFDITLSSFIRGSTEVRVSAFDKLEHFHSYMEETNVNFQPLKQFPANNITFSFDLTSAEMRKSSYVFIIVEDIKGTVSSFTVTRHGQETFYDGKGLKKTCVVNGYDRPHCEVEIPVSIDTKNCFLAQVQRNESVAAGNEAIPDPLDLVYVSHKTTKSELSGSGIVMFAGAGPLFLFCMVCKVVLIVCCVKRLCRR